MTSLAAVLGDLTAETTDVIVNAANAALRGGGGVDGAIHRAGGPSIMDECREIVARQGGCPPGDAVATGGGQLSARWVVHTVGPIWDEDHADEHDATLASAYTRSLEVASDLGAHAIAFPNISTGVYGFPKPRAADVAVGAVNSFLQRPTHGIEAIRFVCFDDENLQLYRRLGL